MEHERMVSYNEGKKLSEDLSCDIFEEISVKESWEDPKRVYTQLWRVFSKKCPNSPSDSMRKKLSSRVSDKIPVMHSTFTMSSDGKLTSLNILNSSMTSLKRKITRSRSSFSLNRKSSADSSESNYNDQKSDSEDDEQPCPALYRRSRRGAVNIPPRTRESLISISPVNEENETFFSLPDHKEEGGRNSLSPNHHVSSHLDYCSSLHPLRNIAAPNNLTNHLYVDSDCSSLSSVLSNCSDHTDLNITDQFSPDGIWRKSTHFMESEHTFNKPKASIS